MAKPVPAKKITVNRKAVSAVTLIVLLALSVIFVWLGFQGRQLDAQGLYKLLPWLPAAGTQTRWREALVPGAELGENLVMTFRPQAESPLTEEEQAETARVLSERLVNLGWRDIKAEATEDGLVRAVMPKAADDGQLEKLLTARGQFSLTDAEGNEILTGKNVKDAGFGAANQAGTDYALSLVFDQEGKRLFEEKTAELGVQSLSMKVDGQAVAEVKGPLKDGAVLVSGFQPVPARDYAVMLRSGALPYALEVSGRAEGAPLMGEGVQNRLILALWAVFALTALYFIIRQRLGGLVAAWMLLMQLALSYFFAALMRAGFNLLTLSAIWLGFLALAFAVIVLFENVREDIRRGRSVRQAVRESYAGRGHAALDVMAAMILICVAVIIIDSYGVAGGFAKVLGLCLLVGLVLSQVALRVILNESLTLFGDRSALYAGGVMKKEEQ